MIEPGGYIKDIFTKAAGQSVTANGWVKTRRDSKEVHFVQLNDGSTFADLQVVIAGGAVPDDILKEVTTGACVRVTGDLVESPASGQAVELAGEGNSRLRPRRRRDLPAAKKRTYNGVSARHRAPPHPL